MFVRSFGPAAGPGTTPGRWPSARPSNARGSRTPLLGLAAAVLIGLLPEVVLK
jgi:hypothetical protein